MSPEGERILILRTGRSQRPFGTGVVSGWQGIDKHYKISDTPRETKYFCETCGAPIKLVISGTPFTSILWICNNGHKFSYVNTD